MFWKNIGYALAITLSVMMPCGEARAGWFDSFFSSGVNCAPQDRNCLLDAALTFQIKTFQEMWKSQTGGTGNISRRHAMDVADILLLMPENRRQAAKDRWSAAGAEPDFFAAIDRELVEKSLVDWLTVDNLRRALETHEAPNGMEFEDFAALAFPIVLEKESQATLALWREHFEMLWQDAFGSVIVVFDWMANHDVEGIERYAKNYKLPQGNGFNPRRGLSLAAKRYCERGDRQSGERLLAILERDRAGWKQDRYRETLAMEWSRMTSGVLACRGDQAALALVDPVLAQMDREIAALQAIEDTGRRKFLSEAIRYVITGNLIEPLVLHLENSGRHQEAAELFARLPSEVSSLSIDISAKGKMVGRPYTETLQQSFDEFLRSKKDAPYYSGDTNAALSWFVEKYNPNDPSYAHSALDIFEKIAPVWPDVPARKAADKLMAIMVDGIAKKREKQSKLDIVSLRIARLEKMSDGCALTETRLKQFLSNAKSYKFDSSRSDMLIDYIRYLDAQPGAAATGQCLVQ